jgi:hypothetical protein
MNIENVITDTRKLGQANPRTFRFSKLSQKNLPYKENNIEILGSVKMMIENAVLCVMEKYRWICGFFRFSENGCHFPLD